MSAAKPPSKEKVKDRWLSAAEIKAVWNADTALLVGYPMVHDVLRLILATLQRPGEECGAIHRSEVDLAKRIWTIPSHKTKNKMGDHLVPLNDLAMMILSKRMRETNGDYLFPHDDDMPVPNWHIAKAVANALLPNLKNVAKFTPHDLRRTGSSWMSMSAEDGDLEIDDMHIGHVLNHRSTTKKTVTARVYNQNKYLPEKRAALDKWGKLLAKFVGIELEQQEAA